MNDWKWNSVEEFMDWAKHTFSPEGNAECDAATDEGRFESYLEEFDTKLKAGLRILSEEAARRREQEKR